MAIKSFRTPTINRKIPTLHHLSAFYETDSLKANLFATIMSGVFNSASLFDEQFKSKIDNLVQNLTLLNPILDIPHFSLDELENQLNFLKSSAPGDDNIDNLMLKNCPNNMRLQILHLFNNIIVSGKIPKDWKVSKITMIPKKNWL